MELINLRTLRTLRTLSLALFFPLCISAQIRSITVTATRAVLSYKAPDATACTVQAADMNRGITAVSASFTGTGPYTVTITTLAAHGLLTSDQIYLENAGTWSGWQQITAITATTTFQFSSSVNTGSVSSSNVGVMVPDVNTNLFTGSNLDTRVGSVFAFRDRTFVLGINSAPTASNSTEQWSRAMQAYSRHHVTIGCNGATYDQDFTTGNIIGGNNWNIGPIADVTNPGNVSYPTIHYYNPNFLGGSGNLAQQGVDPTSGILLTRGTQLLGSNTANNQSFSTAIDPAAELSGSPVWVNPTGPTTGGSASFTG